MLTAILAAVALLSGAIVHPAAAAGKPPLPVYGQVLPDIALRDVRTGAAVRLPEVAAERPAVILVTDGSGGGAACPLARFVAAHQEVYAPWFSWTGVVSGPCAPEKVERLQASSPVRFQRCLHDPEGLLPRALGLARLPALVLANERGFVQAICAAGDEAERAETYERVIHALAGAPRWARGALADFRLPRVGGGFRSFLDVAGRDATILAFLHSGCLPCARELEVLEYLRDRHPDGVRLVAIFLDTAREDRILGYLRAAGVSPDAVLRDPELRLAARYGISAVPALLVVDADGKIVVSRRGYREEERLAMYREIDAALGNASAPPPGACPFTADAIRIHAEACAYLREGRPGFALMQLERLRELAPARPSVHLLVAEAALAAGRRELALQSYARYLAAEPLAYDSGEVRARLATLLAGGEPAPTPAP